MVNFFLYNERMRDSLHPLRDADIRQPLHNWLLDQHADDPTTTVIHELKLPRPSARVDIAVVNGSLEAFEIKSDVDSLARLPRQILSFNRVFDRICIVTTKRHERAVKTTVPHWWGIAVAKTEGEQVNFRRIRKSRQNPETDLLSLLYALHLPELHTILRFGRGKGGRPSSKADLIDQILRLPAQLTRDASREALKARYPKTSSPSSEELGLLTWL
jgi:hypothetical protein